MALILLGGWGLCASLYQVMQCWETYQRSQVRVEWMGVAGNVMAMTQHLAYERGRTAVVLKAPHPVAEADQRFITDRRRQADAAFKALDEKVRRLRNIGYPDFLEKWDRLQDLRRQVDRDKLLLLGQRDKRLPSRWFQDMTDFLNQLGAMGKGLAIHYRQTEEANRLNMVGFFAFQLRLVAGEEASVIAQQVASGQPMPPKDINLVHEMRGSQAFIWEELKRHAAYVDYDDLNQILLRLEVHQRALRSLQDEALSSWKRRRPSGVSLRTLTAQSAPLLDGISDFVWHAIQEANRAAAAKMKVARNVFLVHVGLVFLLLALLLFAMFYVITKVVKPLEAVDKKLRHLHFPMEEDSNFETNQIERLTQTANMLEQVFERKRQLEGELRELAFYDALTHLPNRRLIEDRLLQHIARAKRQKTLLGILFIDLDRFKPINDEFGHEAGDWVLRMVADRILSCIRESDAAARIGGDEFVVLLPDFHQTAAAAAVAEKIREKLSEPFFMPNGQRFDISSSIGIAVYPIHAETVEELMRLSDEAMYEAKHAGRNQVVMAVAPQD